MSRKSRNVRFPDIQPVDAPLLPISARIARVFTRIREFQLHIRLRLTSLEGGFIHRETHTVETGDRPDARI